jgi:hypothetical protein
MRRRGKGHVCCRGCGEGGPGEERVQQRLPTSGRGRSALRVGIGGAQRRASAEEAVS